MKQAISYVRFSSDRQKHGSSVERQEGMIAEWLERHPDYAIADVKFSDPGKSGYHGDHIREAGGFGKLLVAVQQGRIKRGDAVLVEAIDRTGRMSTLKMIMKVIGPILEAGVSIITLDDNATYTESGLDGGNMYLLSAKIQAAHGYSAALSRRVSDSYKSRKRLAKENGVTPKRMTPVWLNSDGTKREEVTPWINTAFELYVSGMGKTAIAKRMRESGVERLAKCSGPTVEGWLRNEAAIGKWGGADVYPPIIEPALFYKAQLHAEKVKTSRPTKTAKHFLVGLVRCGSCGKNYIIQNKDGKPHSMRCRTRQVIKDCDNSHIVPKPVLDKIYTYTATAAAMAAFNQQQMSVDEKAIVMHEAELITLNKRVQGIAQALGHVGDMDELITQLEEVKAQRDAVNNALTLLRRTEVRPAANQWKKIGEMWKLERDDPQQLAAMLRNVGYAITINADGRITTSHHAAVFRYAGVDRKEDKYKLMNGEKLVYVWKDDGTEYPYYEPFDSDEPASSQWDDADYENERLMYE